MKVIIIPNAPIMAGRHYCLAKELLAQGHEVHYLMWALPYNMKLKELVNHLFTSLRVKEYTYEGIAVHTARRLPYFWPYINGWLFKNQLRSLYRTTGADIIFTESYTNETEVPKDLPFIYDLADDYAAPADVYGSPVYKLAFKLLGVRHVMQRQCQNAVLVTVVSGVLEDYAKQHANNVVRLPNGVDRGIIQAVLKDKKVQPKNKHSMVYVTRFGQWSRTLETLAAVKDLRRDFPNLTLTLIGEGTETQTILDFIRDNQAEDYITYTGFVYDRTELFNLMNQSTIGLNISDKNKWRDAAHPIKVLEYSALGKKVVSTNLVEVMALKFPNIYTFAGEPNGLKTAMRMALNDPKTYKDYRRISQQVLDDYSWEGLGAELTQLLRAAAQQGITS